MPIIQYCPVCLGRGEVAYLRRGWRFSLEVVCHFDGCFLLDSCWRCGALLSPLSQTVPSAEFLCVKCGAPFARAPSICLAETIPDQAMVYTELDHLAYAFSPDMIAVLAEDYIDALSAGDLRGTNPTNPADRHIAVILEAERLRRAAAQTRTVRAAGRRARTKQRKSAATSAAAVNQASASSSLWCATSARTESVIAANAAS